MNIINRAFFRIRFAQRRTPTGINFMVWSFLAVICPLGGVSGYSVLSTKRDKAWVQWNG